MALKAESLISMPSLPFAIDISDPKGLILKHRTANCPGFLGVFIANPVWKEFVPDL